MENTVENSLTIMLNSVFNYNNELEYLHIEHWTLYIEN